MDTLEFIKDIPAEQLGCIFKNYFNQHMLAYDLLRGVEFVKLVNIDINTSSIIYSVKLHDEDSRTKLLNKLTSKASSLTIYGKKYDPEVCLNGDILCITIKK